ncbi:MAG: outer membrane lipoprotein-sorting protein [Acidimicrobiia bacterium]|nr:outer membrane lipoprotein-sorting protein [Acidimicrobiia bacterium]
MRVLLIAILAALSAVAATNKDLTQEQVDEIIRKFAAKEAEFAVARENYTYRQTAKVHELDESGSVRGRYEIVSDIIFSNDGKRTERIVHAPVTTLKNIGLTPEDEQDLRSVQPFVLTTKDVDKYHVRYLGHEVLDEIPCYSFAVKPKKMEPGQRYFQGIVWVDDRDLQIVKSYGRGVGIIKKGYDNQFPKFETYREQIDGKYWFPTYTIANDTLHFENLSQRIRLTVRYEDYKQFKSDIRITFGDPVSEGASGEEKPKEPKKP